MKRSRPGFALVLTLTISALLVILAAGLLLTLRAYSGNLGARIEKSRLDSAALVATRLALGALQKEMGKDQVISAPADVFVENSTSSASTSGQPAWIGAFGREIFETNTALAGKTLEPQLEAAKALRISWIRMESRCFGAGWFRAKTALPR